MIAIKKEEQAVSECFKTIFAESTPPADFDEMVRHAKETNYIDCFRDFQIPFMDHKIDDAVDESIIQDPIKKYKIKDPYMVQAFKNSILLGPLPVFKKM